LPLKVISCESLKNSVPTYPISAGPVYEYAIPVFKLFITTGVKQAASRRCGRIHHYFSLERRDQWEHVTLFVSIKFIGN